MLMLGGVDFIQFQKKGKQYLKLDGRTGQATSKVINTTGPTVLIPFMLSSVPSPQKEQHHGTRYINTF